jgi:polyisoprenyl-teichoic acid--peptidoglycan teichoic acid transferase
MTTRNSKFLFGALLLVILVIALAILAGFGAFTFARNWQVSRFAYQAAGPTIIDPEATPTFPAPGETAPGESALAVSTSPVIDATALAPALKPWDGAGRVTILLVGLDYRDWADQKDYSRSDTMILLTMDPATKTAGILSIPRDMWVAIPGFQHGKINTAYYLGQAYKLPGGGPALAVKTVEQFLGVPINYYAQIDFGAFVRFIDEIDGVTVDVPNQITISLQGQEGIKGKKTLKPGRQVLPGEWALAYARNRYTEDGDFDRARRQQQVIMGIRERMLDRNMLPTLIQKAPELFRELSSGIKSNLKLDEVIRLALAAKDVPVDAIQQGVLGTDSVVFGFSPDNLSILIPIPDKIHLLRDKIFTTTGSMKPATPGDTREQMQTEAARLAIYNGAQNDSLASRTAEYLKSQGANVVESSEADKAYSSTTIIDHTGSPFMLRYLYDLIGNPYTKILSRYEPDSPVDVEIYLGADWARNNPLP